VAISNFPPRFLAVPGILLGAVLLASVDTGQAQQAPNLLRIGTSGNLSPGAPKAKENAATATLKDFIRDETGLKNEIVRARDWQDLAKQMVDKQIPLGVFQGHEFAWAQNQHPELKPLVVAANGTPYIVAYMVARKDGPTTNFAGLQGKSLALPPGSEGFPWFFVQRQGEALGKKADAFFSSIQRDYENVEDAVDDVVDGKVEATVVDRTSLEAYKRRKPGRFRQLTELTHSETVPRAVIAYTEGALDQATLDRFRNGLLRAGQQERGQTLLTAFHLTGFERAPADFDKVLATTRKAYPPGEQSK